MRSIVLLALTVMAATSVCGQTVADATRLALRNSQAEAVRLYPDLAQTGSPMNQRFLKAVDSAKQSHDPILSTPNWPLALAKRVAEESGKKEVRVPIANPGRGLAKLVKLTVEQVAANPFSLEGALVEMTGIDRVKIQEIEAGVYEVKIYGALTATLTAALPQAYAAMAEKSGSLLVSVDKPDRYQTTVIIHGNKTMYQGLSTMPTPIWQ